MRRLLLLVLSGVFALVAIPAAHSATAAAFRTAGAESLSLLDGRGEATVSRRGSLLMRVGQGRIRVTDLPGGKPPNVSCDRAGTRVSSSTVVYRGAGVSCRVFGGPWRVGMRGRNIDASGVVRGYLTLAGTRGRYSIGGAAYRRWPTTTTRFKLGDW
jgi:hypothetical protein